MPARSPNCAPNRHGTLSKQRQSYTTIVDGYVIPDFVDNIYAKGQQNDVPLLIGWNKDEGMPYSIVGVHRSQLYGAAPDALWQICRPISPTLSGDHRRSSRRAKLCHRT